MKHFFLTSKKIVFIFLLLNSFSYINTEVQSSTPDKKTEITKPTKHTTRKKRADFVWKFSAGFITGVATMHLLQKTLFDDIRVSGRYCIYRRIKNLF